MSVVVAVWGGGCGGSPVAGADAGMDSGTDSGPVMVDAGDAGPTGLAFHRCGAFECATVQVPADDVDAANGTIGIPIIRVRAAVPMQRIGTLVVLNGGPGVSGLGEAASFYRDLTSKMPEVTGRFDIVFYDRRGAGTVVGLACIDAAWADAYRATPPDPRTTADWDAVDAIWQRFADGCAASMPPYVLSSMSSDATARDVDRIRIALGEDTVSLFTVSGGGPATASYASQFPTHLRAAVLDASAAPRGPSYLTTTWFTQQAPALELQLDGFFTGCGGDATCAFHGGGGMTAVTTAYDALRTSLGTTPLDVGGRAVGAFDMDSAVWWVLVDTAGDATAARARLVALLSAAEAGDGTAMLTESGPWFYDSPSGYDIPQFNAFLGIMLGDEPCPADRAAAEAAWPAVRALAPRMGPFVFNTALSCLHWPTPRATAEVLHPAASPILLLAGAHDFNVLDGPMVMRTALGARASLVRWDGYGHVTYWRSNCMAATASAFLVDPTTWTPPPGSSCADGS